MSKGEGGEEQVDVWALGISAVEMAEGTPPRWAVHPMRVIFMISREPAPQLADRDRWSLPFHDFVSQCLQKVGSLACLSTTCWRCPAGGWESVAGGGSMARSGGVARKRLPCR